MSNASFDEEIKIDEILEHHGIKDMHWGVWNDETKRKYGYLPGKGRKKANPDKADNKPRIEVRTDQKHLSDRVREHYNKHMDKKRAASEAAAAQRKAAEQAAIEQQQKDDYYMRRYGISEERYLALKEATLNSHDPRVVIQGMKYLSDEELEAKITRLEKEGKIKTMAVNQRKEAASAKEAELKARQQTIPYRLAKIGVDAVKQQVVDPALKQVGQEATKALSSIGKKAVDGLQKNPDVKQAKKEVKQAVSEAKDAAAGSKLQSDANRVEAQKRKGKAEASNAAAEQQRQALRDQVNVETGRQMVEKILEMERSRQERDLRKLTDGEETKE